MYRLCITYPEKDEIKTVYSLWYTTKTDAMGNGRRNFMGLYAEKCVEKGIAKIVMETKYKNSTTLSI